MTLPGGPDSDVNPLAGLSPAELQAEYYGALGRRAVACKAWRWTPGMRAVYADVELSKGQRIIGEGEGDGVRAPGRTAVPDFRDPAALGCLLALVREANAPTPVYVMIEHGRYIATRSLDGFGWDGDETIPEQHHPMFATEAEALVVALEAAP